MNTRRRVGRVFGEVGVVDVVGLGRLCVGREIAIAADENERWRPRIPDSDESLKH